MKKYIPVALLLALLVTACNSNGTDPVPASANGLELLTAENPQWQYGNLRLYPIVADDATIQAQKDLQSLLTLSEGMAKPGFRITELKQFGRTQERTFQALTVQNKSRDTILMMSGDVVTGGNQDRVIAYDDIIPPGTIKNIEVFCVEQGRWGFTDSTATESEKAVIAFSGYYNVASPQVRRAVQRTGNQQDVWAAVAKVTSANDAGSGTSAYAALDTENEFKAKRDAYLRFFEGKMADHPNVVGMVAVCNGEVLGVDIFGHPSLFRRQYASLLHGFATEAVTSPSKDGLSETELKRQFQAIANLAGADKKADKTTGKLSRNGRWVHLYSK